MAAGAEPAPGGISLKSVLMASAAVLIAGALSGCVPIIGAASWLYTGTSLVATGLTGKSLTDDALGAVTGKDCSLMDAALEKDRKICETNGSKATAGDFKGLIGMANASPATAETTADAQADTSPPQANVKAVAFTRADAGRAAN